MNVATARAPPAPVKRPGLAKGTSRARIPNRQLSHQVSKLGNTTKVSNSDIMQEPT